MTFTLHVEHEIIDGKTVLEKFEGVESFQSPPTNAFVLQFADDRDSKKLSYGKIVAGKEDAQSPNNTDG